LSGKRSIARAAHRDASDRVVVLICPPIKTVAGSARVLQSNRIALYSVASGLPALFTPLLPRTYSML
jgi:hypothetical protein